MFTSDDINKDAIISELSVLFAAYEKALVENDVPALQAFFWPSPHALRFGSTEELHGAEEIDAFRQNRVINFSGRTAQRQDIISFGDDLGIATLEFTVNVAGEPRYGRQTQIWLRFQDLGWRIVSAHVSHRMTDKTDADLARQYMGQASALLHLPVAAEYADEVVQNLMTMTAIAAPLMARTLADTDEPAPEFTP